MSTINVILIDDDPLVIEPLALVLNAMGCTVTQFTDPRLGLQHIITHGKDADLVLSDLMMPGVSGIKILEVHKAHAPDTPFILMSAHASSEEVARARRLGACAFLAKPFSPRSLEQTIRSALADLAA
jgi:DNA-binding NtrC family response regulator